MAKKSNSKAKLKTEEEEEEEEYNPNQVFEEEEEEEEEEEDLSKLSPEERHHIDISNKSMLFLKALSRDVYQDIPKLAQKCGISENDGYAAVNRAMNVIAETKDDKDFPIRFLKYFDRTVPDNWPDRIYIENDEAIKLVGLFKVVDDKITNSAKIIDPDAVFGKGKITNTETINRAHDENKVLLDSTATVANQDNNTTTYYPNNNTPLENEIENYAGKYGAPDIGLMEMALKQIPNNRPGSIPQFMNAFNNLYLDWMTNPMKMLEQLKFFFGPVHGEHAFRLWRDYRDMYIKKYGNAPMGYYGSGMGGGGDYSPYFANNQMGMGGSQMQPLPMTQEMMEDRMFDRKMKKMMDAIQLSIMQRSMEIQTPSPIGGQNYEEVLDPNTGKVIKRIFLSNGHSQQQNPLEGTLISTLSSFFTEALRGMNNEKIELYKKVNTPDNTLTDFAKTMMSNYLNQSNPAQQIKEMLELTNLVKQQSPQTDQNKSLDALKTELDAKLAMREFDLKQMEIQHNWRMDEKQQQEQDSNVDKWLNTMMQLGEGIIKPVAMEFVKGLGGGANKMMPNPFAGLGAGAGGPSPQQQAAQMQQAQAMQEAQMYNQQQPSSPQQQRMPPIQPIPPMMQQPHRVNQQPQQQARPVSPQHVSDQEINQELSQLSPQQLQEIQDKMALEDATRERIKNAIRAQMNARRFSPRPQQQQEVNKIFNPPVEEDEELSLQDFDDEDDYDVPVASGMDKTVSNKVEEQKRKKFSDFTQESSTETVRKKKLSPQQKELLSEGQLSPRELAMAPDLPDEEGEDNSIGIAGIRNASEDAMVEQNLSKTREVPKKRKSPSKKKEDVRQQQEEKKEDENTVAEAEQLLADVEQIESDGFEE